MTVEPIYLVLMFAGLIAGVFAGYPLGFLMGGLALLVGYMGLGNLVFYQLVLIVGGGVMRNYELSAIPLFVLMGSIIVHSGISRDVYETLNFALRRVTGGVAIATLVLGALISACSGIVGAAVAVTGMVALEPMLSQGYGEDLSTGIICASGGIAASIFPSVLMLIYAPVVGISAARLFTASLIPSAVLFMLYVVYVLIVTRYRRVTVVYREQEEELSLRTILPKFVTLVLPTGAIILGVIASMFFGIARPLEAAGIGALSALTLSAVHRRLTLTTFKTSLLYSVRTCSMILFVVVGASLFSGVFVRLGGDRIAQGLISGLPDSPSLVLFIMILLVILMGTFVECVGTILILAPFYLPFLKTFNLDPVWFGVLFCIALGTAHFTPPVSVALFILRGVAPKPIPIASMYKGLIPFIILQVLTILIVGYFPQLALFLPSLMSR